MKKYNNYYDLRAIYVGKYKGSAMYRILSAPKARQYKFYQRQTKFRKIIFYAAFQKTREFGIGSREEII